MLLIKNGNVHFPKGKTDVVDILIDGKRISKIEKNIQANADVIDATGCEVFPGFILPATKVGIYNYSDLRHTDADEKSNPINLDLHVKYSLDPQEVKMQGYEMHGITAFGAVPGSSALVAGQVGIYRTTGRTVEDMVISEDVALKINFTSDVKREFAKRNIMPMTRMGMMSMLRTELENAKRLEAKDILSKRQKDVWVRVLDGKLPILCRVQEKFEIEVMLELQKEFGFKMILLEAYQSPALAEKIENANVSVLLGDLIDGSAATYYEMDIPAFLKMSENVMTGLSNNGSGFEGLLWSAEKIARYGGNVDKIVDMLTIDTAKILGVDEKIGSIEAGKYADIAIWSKHPLETYDSHVQVCITGGKVWRSDDVNVNKR